MKTNTKNLIRVLAAVAIFAYPGVETYRYFLANQELAKSEQLLAQVETQLAKAKATHQPDVMPVSHQIGK